MDCFGNIPRSGHFVCLLCSWNGLFCQAKGQIPVVDARAALCFGVVLGSSGPIDQGIEAGIENLSVGHGGLASVLDWKRMVVQRSLCCATGRGARLLHCHCGRSRSRENGGTFF